MTQTAAPAARTEDSTVLRARSVGVRFGQNQVLTDISLELSSGTITALLGTNGAGKSTLIGAISGAYPHYTGSISLAGETSKISSPATARRRGIETVHQRIADGIVPGLSVADNLLLNDLATSGHRLVRRPESEREARRALTRLGLTWSTEVLRADAAHLGTSDRQLLILARALRSTPRLLILDEPTSALTDAESDRLFDVLRDLRDDGLAIVIVSHRFGEIERLADRIVVLRDGGIALSATRPFDWPRALEAMLGVSTALQAHVTDPLPAGEAALTVTGAHLLPGSAPLDLTVHDGQVTGILGLIGAGKTELAETIVGERRAGAAMSLDERAYEPHSVADALAARVALVPEDRQRDGIQPGWSIAHTVSLPMLKEITDRLGILRGRRERAIGSEVIDGFNVIAEGSDDIVDELSGGNQQKVLVGRWLRTDPRVAVLDEPFRGVDIAARRVIGEAARSHARAGNAVLVMSSDVDEILEVADRIVVLVGGQITLDAIAGAHDRTRVVAALLDENDGKEPA